GAGPAAGGSAGGAPGRERCAGRPGDAGGGRGGDGDGSGGAGGDGTAAGAPLMRLRHRVAVITGSSRGIGRAIAQALAREGAAVVLNAARSIGEAQAAADAIVRAGGRALAVQADVGDPGDARALIGQAAEALGRVDILVNNAGYEDRAGIWQIDDARWARMLA